MDDGALGASVRLLRHRRRWRQVDLAAKAGVSAGVVGLLERGRADRITVRAIRRICSALEVRVGWDVGFRGPELARLRDADHASLTVALAGMLQASDWETAAEVSFNHYGERGRVDLLAFHRRTRVLLVCEVKTVVVEVQALVGSLDVKRRVGHRAIQARDWEPVTVVACLVVADGSTNRRRIAQHARLFDAFPLRGRAVRAWLRRPRSPAPRGMLLFLRHPDRNPADGRRAGRQRVRLPGARPSGRSLAPRV